MLACLVALLLALYPLLHLHVGPTAVSLGNNDPGCYSATARFLQLGSIRHPPACNNLLPLSCLVHDQVVANSRPGTFLLIGLFADLFRLQTYQIFTVLLAVVLALTPPLVGIFVEVASGNRFAALLALLLSALSVNQLYFFYHGFAGQVFGEGCLIIAFILVWKAESDRKHWASYAFTLGLAMCGMLELYQENAALFFAPWGVYFLWQVLEAKTSRWRLVCRFAVPVGIVFALDPFAFWYGLVCLWHVRAAAPGWSMPRWALPADIIGLMNVYLPSASERFASVAGMPVARLARWLLLYGRVAAIASIPVTGVALFGFLYWRNPRLTLSVTLVMLALLLYEFGGRHFSYGYHKVAANVSFLLIAAFATGVARAVRGRAGFRARRRAAGAVVTLLAAGCLFATIPLVVEMQRLQQFVGPDLVELTTIKRLAGNRPVHLIENRHWQQLWAVYFLDPVPTLLDDPGIYFGGLVSPPASPNVLTLLPESPDTLATSSEDSSPPEREDSRGDNEAVSGPERRRVLWHNEAYLLLSPGS